MLHATIYVDEIEVKRRLGNLSGQSGKVISRAANRAATKGKTTIAKFTTEKYLLTTSTVNSTLKISKASASNPTAKLVYKGPHKNIYSWGSGRAGTVSPKKKISWKNGKPNVKTYKSRVKKGAFHKLGDAPKPFVQTANGGTALFRRASNNRSAPLVGVAAPAIPQVVKNEQTIVAFKRDSGEMFQKRLEHEIRRVLEGH